MKSCSIYKTKKHYKIVPFSETEAGFLINTLPIFILNLESTLEELENVIFKALEISNKIIPVPKRDEYKSISDLILKEMKEKSFTSLYKNSSSCEIKEVDGVMSISPEQFADKSRPSQGLINVKEETLRINDPYAKKQEISKIIKELLEKKFR